MLNSISHTRQPWLFVSESTSRWEHLEAPTSYLEAKLQRLLSVRQYGLDDDGVGVGAAVGPLVVDWGVILLTLSSLEYAKAYDASGIKATLPITENLAVSPSPVASPGDDPATLWIWLSLKDIL